MFSVVFLLFLFNFKRLFYFGQVILEILSPTVNPLNPEINTSRRFTRIFPFIKLIKALLDHLILKVIQRNSSHPDNFIRGKRIFIHGDHLKVFLSVLDVESVVVVPDEVVLVHLLLGPAFDFLAFYAQNNRRALFGSAFCAHTVQVFAFHDAYS